MKKSLLALVLLSASLPGAAWAATGTSSSANDYSSSFTFAGPYGGVALGFSSMTNNMEVGSVNADEGTTGFGYGLYGGYGVQVQGPWYIGGELGISNTTGSTKFNSIAVASKSTQDYMFTADLRAGKVIGESTLIYGKLGWAHTEFDQNVTVGGTSSSDNETFDGIRFGAGAETLLSANITGRLEAVYTDYGSQTVNAVKFSPDDVGVRFGISYYFY